jgi:hypothetical protein
MSSLATTVFFVPFVLHNHDLNTQQTTGLTHSLKAYNNGWFIVPTLDYAETQA